MITSSQNTLLVYIILVPIIVLVLFVINVLIGAHRPDAEKVSAYDCGIIAIGHSRNPFPIAYYLVAILFIIFDIEILLIYPIAVNLYSVEISGFWVVIIFVLILTLGFVFEIGSGALQFTKHRSSTMNN